jgi:hypothetical protein
VAFIKNTSPSHKPNNTKTYVSMVLENISTGGIHALPNQLNLLYKLNDDLSILV